LHRRSDVAWRPRPFGVFGFSSTIEGRFQQPRTRPDGTDESWNGGRPHPTAIESGGAEMTRADTSLKNGRLGLIVALAMGAVPAACGKMGDGPADQVTASRSALTAADVLGFESAASWSTTTAGAVLSTSPNHTQGASSLAVKPSSSNGYTPIVSVPLSTLAAISPTIAVDVMLPVQQANPSWLGTMQMYINCPSRNIFNAFLAQVELTGKPLNVWNTVTFPVTNAELASLLAAGYSDLQLTVVLNVQVPTSGTYFIDNLRFVPQASAACGGQPNGVACDDGNPCTVTDTCQAGACTGAAKSCAASDQCHVGGTCDPGTGACLAGVPAPDWTSCTDTDLCKQGKACHAGVCGGGLPVCDDGNPCTTDVCSASTGACTHGALAADACTTALATAPALKGRVTFATTSDNNRCVPDALHVLNRLNATGEVMGWHYHHAGYAGLDSDFFHTETLIRMPYRAGTALDGSLFVSSWSHPPGGPGGIMGVAQMQFKGGNQGKLLLTNRAYNLDNTGPEAEWDVTPNPGDSFMKLGPQQTPGVVLDPTGTQNHPGGGSALGTHVAMSLQGFVEDCGVPGDLIDVLNTVTFGIFGVEGNGCTPDSSEPIVQIWDLACPLNPQLRTSYITHENGTPQMVNIAPPNAPPNVVTYTPGTSMMAVALTKLNDGRFLMVGDPDKPVGRFEFYISTGTNLDDPNVFGAPKRVPDAIVNMGDGSTATSPPPGWQSFNFITDCNGDLYLLGTRGAVSGDQDVVDSYKVTIAPAASPSACGTAYCATMTRADNIFTTVVSAGDLVINVADGLGRKHMQCDDNHGTDQCDLNSGAGTYVDPDGQVIVYSTNFDDDGGVFNSSMVYGNGLGEDGKPFSPATPYAAFGGFIRGMEFHERHGNAAAGAACPTLADAWVELYQNPNYNNFGDDSGQIYRTNYSTRNERNNKAFGTNDFDGKASSIRWCIPVGSSFRVYDQHWAGASSVLKGTGHVAEIANLSQGSTFTYPDGQQAAGGTMNDSITSGQFQDDASGSVGLMGVPDNSN
jgi:hypothetical protein